jgi:hypothetical protein
MSRPSPAAAPGNGGGPTYPATTLIRLELSSEGTYVDPESQPSDRDRNTAAPADGAADTGSDSGAGPVGSAFSRARRIAADHVNDETTRRAQQISGNAGQISTRGKARLTRGGERASEHMKSWLAAEDHNPPPGQKGEPRTAVKAGRWFVVGVGGLIAVRSGLMAPETIAIDAAVAAVTCWRYGGPWGEAKIAELRLKRCGGPAALPPGVSAGQAGAPDHGGVPAAFRAPDADVVADGDVPVSAAQPGPALTPGQMYIIKTLPDGQQAVQLAAPGEEPVPVDAATGDALGIADLAAEIVAALGHQLVGLPGSTVLDINRTPDMWTAHLELPAGRTAEDIIGKLKPLESTMNVRPLSLMPRQDPELARQAYLTRLIRDPLAGMVKGPHVPFGSVSITRPYRLGTFEDGEPVLLDMLGKHVGVVGTNGSGKSNLLGAILENLSASPDVVIWPIDLQGSASLIPWELCAGRPVATTPEEAHDYLRDAFAISQRRAKILGRRVRNYVLSDGLGTSEYDWAPTRDEPALVIPIDEFSLLNDEKALKLVEYVLKIMRTGRKSRVTILLANQRADEKTMGRAAIRKELTMKLLMRCEAGDVDFFLGNGFRSSGWLADRFGLPGLFFINGGPHQTPRRARIPEMTLPGVREAIRDYAPQRESIQLDAESTFGLAEAVREEDWTEALTAVVIGLMEDNGIDRITTAGLMDAMTKRNAKWAENDPPITTLIRDELGLRTDSHRGLPERARGYLLRPLLTRLEELAAQSGDDSDSTDDDSDSAEDTGYDDEGDDE